MRLFYQKISKKIGQKGKRCERVVVARRRFWREDGMETVPNSGPR